MKSVKADCFDEPIQATPCSRCYCEIGSMIRRILDALHEIAIRQARGHFLRYPSAANSRRYSDMIRARSPEQVARMEKG